MAACELTTENAASYLAERGLLQGTRARVTELGGGVSNTVLLVEDGGQRLVVKQSLEKLRVQDDWRAPRNRIQREAACIRALHKVLPPAVVPEVLAEDSPNYIFVMTAAPAGARSWKDALLAGEIDPYIARRAGEVLAQMHAAVDGADPGAADFADQTCFEQLRVDPYYRTVMQRHPDLAPVIGDLIDQMQSRRTALVHGDYSPKNLLLAQGDIVLIDFEVVHIGDPAFDTGFCLNHLLLKSFHRPQQREAYIAAAREFWDAYAGGIESATCQHLGALLLARVDGKSPAEYLDADARARVRQAARRVLIEQPSTLAEVFDVCRA